MKKTRYTITLAWLLLPVGASAQDDAELPPETETQVPPGSAPEGAPGQVRHLPVHQLDATETVRFEFVIDDPGAIDRVVVRYRPLDAEGPVREAVARRMASSWEATVEGAELPRPGIAYWAVATTRAGESPIFASADDPHPAHLREPYRVEYERAQLERRGGRRSRVAVHGEYVQLGTRAVVESGGERRELDEHYYQLEASFAYAFFLVVDEIRFALGRMRGNVVDTDRPEAEQDERGLDYGTARITWHVHDLLRFRTGILFGFSHVGFELGGSGDVVIGEREGTNLTLGVEGVSRLGATGRARLGWLTVPRLPMGATVEITNWPVGDVAGLRLLFDVAYEIYPGAYVQAEVGYRGWDSTTGGLSAGGEVALAF